MKRPIGLGLLCSGLGLALSSCLPDVPTACQQHARAIPIGYIGELHGNGVIRLSVDGTGAMHGQIELFNGQESDSAKKAPLATVSGVGTCVQGDIRMRFGSSNATVLDRYRIRGATVVGMLAPELVEGALGYWEAELIDVKTEGLRTVAGFWKERPDVKKQAQQAQHAQRAPSQGP